MSGGDTLEIAVGFDLDAKGLTKSLAERTESTLVVEILRPRAHWKVIAKALAEKERPHIRRLVLRSLVFDPSAAVGRAMLSPKAGDTLWAALPNLEALELVGHGWATTLTHPSLRELRMTGFGFTGSFMKKPADCPKLERLTWAFTGDEFGVAPSVSNFKGLWKAEGLGALRHLDFGGAELDGDLLSGSSFMKSALLAQLESLVLPEESIDSLPKKLPKLTHVKSVSLANASLPATRVDTVAVEPMPLGLDRCGDELMAFLVRDEGIDGLLAALDAQPEVKGLALRSHSISAEAGRLGEALARRPELRSLALDRPHIYGLEAEGLKALAEGLGAHAGLRRLNLRKNRLTGAAEALTEWSSSLPSLEVLDLDQTSPGEGEVETLVEGLGRCATLRELTYGGNVKGEAAGAFTALRNGSLEQLAVWGLKAVPPEVMTAFAGGLGDRLPKLRSLRVGAYLDDGSAIALVDALRGSSIESLSVGVKGGLEGLVGLGDALSSLTSLELESMTPGDTMGTEDAERFTRLLAGTGTLEHLTIDGWELADDVVTPVLDAIASHGSLRSVRGLDPESKLHADALQRFAGQLAESGVRRWADLPYGMAEALVRANVVEDLTVESRKLAEWMAELPLADCTSINTLRLVGGMLEPAALKVLASVAADHRSLRSVVLTGAMETEALFDFVEALEGTPLDQVTFDLAIPAAIGPAIVARTDGWSGPTLVL